MKFFRARLSRLFFGIPLLLFYGTAAAVAEGAVLRSPAVLYDSHSEQATPLLILSAGHPLRFVSRVDGWRKVSLFTGETGWVRERFVREKRAAIVAADIAAARTLPSSLSPEVFYARRGVALEVLRTAGAWLEVLHPDGETGYIAAADLWTNY